MIDSNNMKIIMVINMRFTMWSTKCNPFCILNLYEFFEYILSQEGETRIIQK
jgi:hypothetical protein